MIFKGSILGTVTQSAGTVTVSKWKGHLVAKDKITSNDSKTPKQEFQRARFAFIQAVATRLKDDIIVRFWKKWETAFTTYMNAFNSYNIPKQPQPAEPLVPFVPDFSLLKLVRGNVENVRDIIAPTYNNLTGVFNISWGPDTTGNGSPSDKIIVIVFDIVNDMIYIDTSKIRTDEAVSLSLPAGISPGVNGMVSYIATFRGLPGEEVTSDTLFNTVSEV